MSTVLDWGEYERRVREHGQAVMSAMCSPTCKGREQTPASCSSCQSLGVTWRDIHEPHIFASLEDGRKRLMVSPVRAASMSLPKSDAQVWISGQGPFDAEVGEIR